MKQLKPLSNRRITDLLKCAFFLNANNVILDLSLKWQDKKKNLKDRKMSKNEKKYENSK